MNTELHTKINTRRAGVFARWARARKLMARIAAHTKAGGTVYFSTATTRTPIKAQHVEGGMVKAGKDGVYVQRGRRWDCMAFGTVAFA